MLLRFAPGFGFRGVLSSVTRASEWWEYKLAPTFATFYATALWLQIPLHTLWPLLLTVLLALAPGAAYVSLLNDLTDLRDDLAGGKANRLNGKSRRFVALALILSVAPGIGFAFYWRGDWLVVGLYGAAWLAFSLYSLPPFRLKNRGFLGMLADAAGSNLFPHALVAVLVFRWNQTPLDGRWLAFVAGWSFFYGLRGILWHQLCDLQFDEKSNVRTFARLHPPALLKRLGEWLIFPLELAALAGVLILLGNALVWISLGFYVVVEAIRVKLSKVNVIIVAPRPRFRLAMQDFYDVFYPLALLLSSTKLHAWDALVLLIHVVVFPHWLFVTLRGLIARSVTVKNHLGVRVKAALGRRAS